MTFGVDSNVARRDPPGEHHNQDVQEAVQRIRNSHRLTVATQTPSGSTGPRTLNSRCLEALLGNFPDGLYGPHQGDSSRRTLGNRKI